MIFQNVYLHKEFEPTHCIVSWIQSKLDEIYSIQYIYLHVDIDPYLSIYTDLDRSISIY